MDAPIILAVQPVENKKLQVKFVNCVEKIYDCKPLIEKFETFSPLENEVFFKLVKADKGGYGISWDDKVDLNEYELRVNSKELAAAEQE